MDIGVTITVKGFVVVASIVMELVGSHFDLGRLATTLFRKSPRQTNSTVRNPSVGPKQNNKEIDLLGSHCHEY